MSVNPIIQGNLAEIEELIDKRRISLYHFTPLKNLENILKLGLVAQWSLAFGVTNAVGIDDSRPDPRNLCFSIGFPNYKMFYSKRQASPMAYAVLELKPTILTEKEWLALPTNSSRRLLRGQMQDAPGVLRSYEALKLLFMSHLGTERGIVERSNLQIPSSYTTDPQAEIQVESEIVESRYIHKVHFETDGDLASFSAGSTHASGFELVCSPVLFDKRQDWRFWQNNHVNYPVERHI